MKSTNLSRSIQILLLLFLIIAGLILGREFLVPLAFAGIISMLFLPLAAKMERSGWNRALAVVVCLLIFIVAVGGIITLLGWQLSGLAEDITKAKGNITKIISDLQHFISQHLGISAKQQEKIVEKQQSSVSSNGGDVAKTVLAGAGSIFTNTILVLVYVFLLMYYRTQIKKFILKLIPQQQHEKADHIMYNSSHVSQKYLTGLFMMIGCLWVMYGVGFSIVGVKHAIFFAVLCGTLELVPFVGNITGTTLTALMALTQGGGTGMVLEVIAVYSIVQFIQSYFLQTLVVASEVNINPLFTIIGLVLGESIWGIPGMILAIPLMGVGKVICDNIEPLKPFAYLVGGEDKEGGLKKKIKKIFKKN